MSLTIGADSPDSTAGVVVVTGSATSPASSGSVMIGSVSTATAGAVVTGAGGDVVTCACSVVVKVVVEAAIGGAPKGDGVDVVVADAPNKDDVPDVDRKDLVAAKGLVADVAPNPAPNTLGTPLVLVGVGDSNPPPLPEGLNIDEPMTLGVT